MIAFRHALAWALAGCLLLSGCGASSTPAEDVPELAGILASVDDALAQERYPQARRQLRQLVSTAEDARASGDLGDGETDRVLAAAAKLLAVLPAGTGQSPAEPEGESVPAPQPDDTGQGQDDEVNGDQEQGDERNENEGQGDDEEAKKLEEEQKKLEEERKKLEDERKKQEEDEGGGNDKGGGNGDSSENGPDDGHGNS